MNQLWCFCNIATTLPNDNTAHHIYVMDYITYAVYIMPSPPKLQNVQQGRKNLVFLRQFRLGRPVWYRMYDDRVKRNI